ncbi:hypothetical protein Bca101_050569 [Brassica carinata]
MDFCPRTRRLDGLSSWNPEAGCTFVVEPGAWTDFRPGSRRLDGLSSWNPEAGWTFVLEPGGWMDLRPGTRMLVELLSKNLMVSSVFLYQNRGASSNASSSYPWEDLQTEPDVLGS